jgi:hypothetical protein
VSCLISACMADLDGALPLSPLTEHYTGMTVTDCYGGTVEHYR